MSELHFDVTGAAGPRTFFSRMRKDTLAHGYLFSGPRGTGKKMFARRLAQSLLCEAPHDTVLGYDGTCTSCRLFGASDASRHPDFIEYVGTLKIGDTDSASGFYGDEELSARDIVRQLSLESYSGGMRVLLLGDVDFATHHAANALLKFFEEPPAGVVLILTTDAPGRLISTIRSRLVEVRFPPLSREERAKVAVPDEEEDSLRAQVADWFFEAVSGATPEDSWATRETLDDGLEVIKSLTRDWVALGTAGKDAPLVSGERAARLGKLDKLDASRSIAMLAKIDDAQRLARTNVPPTMVSELVRMALTP